MAKDGQESRRPGCFYSRVEHEAAAINVRKRAPEVFEWIKANPEGLPGDLRMHKLIWQIAMETMPKASLIDLTEVGLMLRLEANPLSAQEKEFLLSQREKSAERRRRRQS